MVGPPLIASHVGADVAADLVAIDADAARAVAGCSSTSGPTPRSWSATGSRILAASCPAGPAFEGGLVRYGMPGSDGAIERARLDGARWRLETIGDVPPEGICGSGLDRPPGGAPPPWPDDAARRLRRPSATSSWSSRTAASPCRATTPATWPRPRPPMPAGRRSCCATSASPLAARPRLPGRRVREPRRRPNAIAIGFLRRCPPERVGKVGNAVDPRRAAAAAVAAPSRRPGRAGAPDRACRAGDDAGLLRALRRGLPVQADARHAVIGARPGSVATGHSSIIGENIHTTRVLLRSGRQVAADGDDEWIAFDGRRRASRAGSRSRTGTRRPRSTLPGGSSTSRSPFGRRWPRARPPTTAVAYLRLLAQRQIDAGAAYLDLNVDELSPKLAEQKAAIRWLVDARAELDGRPGLGRFVARARSSATA